MICTDRRIVRTLRGRWTIHAAPLRDKFERLFILFDRRLNLRESEQLPRIDRIVRDAM